MFKRLIIPAMILATAIPLMAQRPGRAVRPRSQQSQAVRVPRLTPEEREALKALVEANKPNRQAIRQEIRHKVQAVKNLRSQANPNPTELGNAMLALREARGRAQQMRQDTMERFKNSLTPEQQKRIEDFQARRKARRGR